MNSNDIDGLIGVLRDPSARIEARDDAAMDLGDSDDPLAMEVLLDVARRSDEDELVLWSVGESIAQIAIRTGTFDPSWLEAMAPAARGELVGSLRAVKPDLLDGGARTAYKPERLPPSLQAAARAYGKEFAWPLGIADRVVDALADAGSLILGYDVWAFDPGSTGPRVVDITDYSRDRAGSVRNKSSAAVLQRRRTFIACHPTRASGCRSHGRTLWRRTSHKGDRTDRDAHSI
jgi:hypothetical protein